MAKLCELILSDHQSVIFGGSGRRTFVKFSNTSASTTDTPLKIEAVVVAAVVVAVVVAVVIVLAVVYNFFLLYNYLINYGN